MMESPSTENKWVGKKLCFKEVTTSTMDDALAGALNGAIPGTAYLAEVQTAGRGSGNNKFESKTSGNIYISYVYHKILEDENPKIDMLYSNVSASLAVFLTLREIGVPGLCMKWLNDIWTRGHKIAGILVENKGLLPYDLAKSMYGDDKQIRYIFIVGIGINVNQDMRRHPTMHSIATSVKCELGGETVDRDKLLVRLNKHLEEFLPLKFKEIFERTEAFQLFKNGELVHVLDRKSGENYTAELLSINKDWSVSLKSERGVQTQFPSDVSLRPNRVFNTYIYGGHLVLEKSASALLQTFEALQDVERAHVRILSHSQFMNVQWNKETDFIVLGECVGLCEKNPPEDLSQLLQQVKSIVSDGLKVFACGNMAHILQQFMENNQIPADDADNTDRKNVSSFKIFVEGKHFEFNGFAFKTPQTIKPDPDSTVCGFNKLEEGPVTTITGHGQGQVLLVGFNIEVTDAATCGLQDANLSILETVFDRDKCFQAMLSCLRL